jgi:signal transduction histidine kinase
MLRGLRPVEVDANGLMAAIDDLVNGTAKVYDLCCTFACNRPVPLEDNTVATQLFYIAREAITNAARHAKPTIIEVRLGVDGPFVTFMVRDDGVGIQADRNSGGMGMRIMRYRASLIGATLDIGPATGGGTIVTCVLKQEKQYADEQDDIE